MALLMFCSKSLHLQSYKQEIHNQRKQSQRVSHPLSLSSRSPRPDDGNVSDRSRTRSPSPVATAPNAEKPATDTPTPMVSNDNPAVLTDPAPAVNNEGGAEVCHEAVIVKGSSPRDMKLY